MAHAWKACWVQALGGSNPPSSATNPGPSGSGFFFMPYLLPLFPAPAYSPGLRSLPRAPPAPDPLSPGPGFTPGPAFSRRRRPPSSETKIPATHCMTGIDGGSAGIRTRGGLHHTAFRVLHLRPLGHATSAAQFTGDYSQYANLTYPAALT